MRVSTACALHARAGQRGAAVHIPAQHRQGFCMETLPDVDQLPCTGMHTELPGGLRTRSCRL